MKYAYYPGCSGHGTSVEYEISTRAVCNALNMDLVEIEDWNCCGSTPAHSVSHELSGALHGMFRVRCFTQDDAHILLAKDQFSRSIFDQKFQWKFIWEIGGTGGGYYSLLRKTQRAMSFLSNYTEHEVHTCRVEARDS